MAAVKEQVAGRRRCRGSPLRLRPRVRRWGCGRSEVAPVRVGDPPGPRHDR